MEGLHRACRQGFSIPTAELSISPMTTRGAPPGAAVLNSERPPTALCSGAEQGCRLAPFLTFSVPSVTWFIDRFRALVQIMAGVLKKYELEAKLKDEHKLIEQGILRDENPLDLTSDFSKFLGACRKGDLKTCQELISNGVNINGKDAFDYTPLIIASLCGHFELVQLLLESGLPPWNKEMTWW